jgi:hypothetical protein
MLSKLKNVASDWLWIRSVRETHSRGEWRNARRYTQYLDRARRLGKVASRLADPFDVVQRDYRQKDFASFRTPQTTALLAALLARISAAEAAGENIFGSSAPLLGAAGWTRFPEIEALLTGDLGTAFRAIFGAEFKVHFAIFDRKRGDQIKSKFWHSDSGPATCLNVFCYLGEATPAHGPTYLLPWPQSLALYEGEKRYLRRHFEGDLNGLASKNAKREFLAEYYRNGIEAQFSTFVERPSRPAGTIVVFNNNVLHCAQPPESGKERLTLQLRVYPSDQPPDFTRYAAQGLPGKLPYPEPNAIF